MAGAAIWKAGLKEVEYAGHQDSITSRVTRIALIVEKIAQCLHGKHSSGGVVADRRGMLQCHSQTYTPSDSSRCESCIGIEVRSIMRLLKTNITVSDSL